MNADAFNRAIEEARVRTSGFEAELARAIEEAFRAAGRRAATAYRDAASALTASAFTAAASPRPDPANLVDVAILLESAGKRSRAARRKALAAVGAEIAAETGIAWDVRSPLVAPILDGLAAILDEAASAFRDEIAQTVADAYEAGLSVAETAAAIVEKADGIAAYRAAAIARTDLAALANGGSLSLATAVADASDEAGEDDYPRYKTWLTAGDALVRPSHVATAGQTKPLAQPFSVGGSLLQYPGDPSGNAADWINCRCTLLYSSDPALELAASAEDESEIPWEVDMTAMEHDAVTAATFTAKERERLAEEGVAMPDGSFPIRNRSDLKNAIASIGRAADYEKAKRHIVKRARDLNALEMLPEDWGVTSSVSASASSASDQMLGVAQSGLSGDEIRSAGAGILALAAASVAPLAPPDEWFDDPRLTEPTPLTVTADGRVYGHLAEWGKCHTGIQGRCVMAPRSASNYAGFHTGSILLASGEQVRIGKITVGTGHAKLGLGAAATVAHYDNTGTVAAFVRAGEDRFGPWLAGAVRSDATPEQVRDLRANAPSGDWRQDYPGAPLELRAALAVPVPGFPVAALAASGEITALLLGWQSDETLALVASGELDGFDDGFARMTSVLAARSRGVEGLADLIAVR